jgi:hypothetical protein
LNTQVKFTELKEIRPQSSSGRLWLLSQPSAPSDSPLGVRAPSVAALRWNSSPVRRVKHPRLQFDKGQRVDLLA